MKLTVYDRQDYTTDQQQESVALTQFILEGLDSLDTVTATYSVYNTDASENMPIDVTDMVRQHGENILPITVVNGDIVKTATHPTPEEFSTYTGIHFTIESEDACDHTHEGVCSCGHHH